MHRTLQETLKIGWIVISLLGILTAIEFAIAIVIDDTPWLFTLLLVAALAKAWLIIQYFMHFGQLWQHVSEAWYGMLGDDEDDTDED